MVIILLITIDFCLRNQPKIVFIVLYVLPLFRHSGHLYNRKESFNIICHIVFRRVCCICVRRVGDTLYHVNGRHIFCEFPTRKTDAGKKTC